MCSHKPVWIEAWDKVQVCISQENTSSVTCFRFEIGINYVRNPPYLCMLIYYTQLSDIILMFKQLRSSSHSSSFFLHPLRMADCCDTVICSWLTNHYYTLKTRLYDYPENLKSEFAANIWKLCENRMLFLLSLLI